MKKLFLFIFCAVMLTACASVKEAQNVANCQFALKSVELTDYNLTSFGFDVVVAITNPNKTEAATVKRFEGVLTANDDKMADVTLKDVRIEPRATKNAKAKITVPMSAFNSKLLGLISMGSGTLDYHLTGTMYFDGPLGTEIPVPVDIGRYGSYNITD
ncbi:LEA type 2 family protein [Candidatus Avelusimicrobium sp.]|uniref:LEA type 2 family protein n=1 Tax=Candidatus Avelusimicrobium sp. TaxID=3048833 RepID=UPI003D7CFCBC